MRKAVRAPTSKQLQAICEFGSKLIGNSDARSKMLGKTPYNFRYTLADVNIMVARESERARKGKPIDGSPLEEFPELRHAFECMLSALVGKGAEKPLKKLWTIGRETLGGNLVVKNLSPLHFTLFSNNDGRFVAFDHSDMGTIVMMPGGQICLSLFNRTILVEEETTLLFGEKLFPMMGSPGGYAATIRQGGKPEIGIYGMLAQEAAKPIIPTLPFSQNP